jgi:ATP-binding cassette subfamily B multidrug efflux pump
MLGASVTTVVRASASAQRIYEILDAPVEIADRPGAFALPAAQGRVQFERVSFNYFGGRDVLHDISFEAQPGQMVALLGRTGSGKSTIINLIPRFYDVSAGCVRVDGYDVRDVTVASLRRQVGVVLQENTLMAGTIHANIAMGCPDCTLERVVEAARAAHIHDFIAQLPAGYDTPIGERGVTLSGGQKQRIAIARTLLTDPHILILDDSTSNVDIGTEQLIYQSLDELVRGRTSFVVAHRLSTVRRADLILVLDDGCIAARGTHDELLENSPLYAEIYHVQLRREDGRQGKDAECLAEDLTPASA